MQGQVSSIDAGDHLYVGVSANTYWRKWRWSAPLMAGQLIHQGLKRLALQGERKLYLDSEACRQLYLDQVCFKWAFSNVAEQLHRPAVQHLCSI